MEGVGAAVMYYYSHRAEQERRKTNLFVCAVWEGVFVSTVEQKRVRPVCIVLYCIVLIGAFISIFSNRLKAPHGDESFEACCQWALLNVHIITLLFPQRTVGLLSSQFFWTYVYV